MRQRKRQRIRRKQIQRERVYEAMRQLSRVQEIIAFEQVNVTILEDGHRWRFCYRDQLLLDFWPALAKYRELDAVKTRRCRGAVRAARAAVSVRDGLLARITRAFQAPKTYRQGASLVAHHEQ